MASAARNPVAFLIASLVVVVGLLSGALWGVSETDPWKPSYVFTGVALFVGIFVSFLVLTVKRPLHLMGDPNAAATSGPVFGTKDDPKDARDVDRDPNEEPKKQ